MAHIIPNYVTDKIDSTSARNMPYALALNPTELVGDPCGVDAFLGGVEDPVGEIPPPFGSVGRRPEDAALDAIDKFLHLRFRVGNVRARERLGVACSRP